MKNNVLDLLKLLNSSPSSYHAVMNLSDDLEVAGFKQKNISGWTNLQEGDRFFLRKNDSALLACSIGKNPKSGIKIIGSHTDSPCLKLKPCPVLNKEGGIVLNTEVYGGAILHTWFDRPLGLAGRITYLIDGEIKSSLLNWKEASFIIPSLAIHMNREVNQKLSIEKQQTLLPVICLKDEDKNLTEEVFNRELLRRASVDVSAKLLAHDLYFYDLQESILCGLNEEFINSPKLDNLAMAHASVKSIINACESGHEGIILIFAADNEEVGSRTQQGANSLFLRQTLECICNNVGFSQNEFLQALDEALFISADLAHAVHPHYPNVADPSHRPQMNRGPVIKIAANQSYASDSKSSARFIKACLDAKVPYQIFVNHSDRPGGSTIGPITTAYLTMPTVDIGNAVWAMHSIRETGSCLDHEYMIKALTHLLLN